LAFIGNVTISGSGTNTVKLLSDIYATNNKILGLIELDYDSDAYKNNTLSSDVLYDMWDSWGMEGMVDVNGNKCPQYVSITDETLYRDTAVVASSNPEAWVSAKYLYDNYYAYGKYYAGYGLGVMGYVFDPDAMGAFVVKGNLTIDLNSHKYDVDCDTGSASWEGFLVKKDTKLALKNGEVSSSSDKGLTLVLAYGGDSTFTFENCTFSEKNYHNAFSFAWYNEGTSNISFKDCTFHNASIKFGYSHTTTLDVSFQNCDFTATYAKSYWGDPYVQFASYSSGNASFKDCDFTMTSTQGELKAIENNNGSLNLTLQNVGFDLTNEYEDKDCYSYSSYKAAFNVESVAELTKALEAIEQRYSSTQIPTINVMAGLTISSDTTIGANTILKVNADKTLTVALGATLTNKGTIVNNGTINCNGTLDNNGFITNNNKLNIKNIYKSTLHSVATLQELNTAISTQVGNDILLTANVSVDGDFTIPANINIVLAPGVDFTVSGTLTRTGTLLRGANSETTLQTAFSESNSSIDGVRTTADFTLSNDINVTKTLYLFHKVDGGNLFVDGASAAQVIDYAANDNGNLNVLISTAA